MALIVAMEYLDAVPFDQRIVSAMIRLSLCGNKRTVKTSFHDRSSLHNSVRRNQSAMTEKRSLILLRRHLRHLVRITNKRTLLPPIKRQQPLAY